MLVGLVSVAWFSTSTGERWPIGRSVLAGCRSSSVAQSTPRPTRAICGAAIARMPKEGAFTMGVGCWRRAGDAAAGAPTRVITPVSRSHRQKPVLPAWALSCSSVNSTTISSRSLSIGRGASTGGLGQLDRCSTPANLWKARNSREKGRCVQRGRKSSCWRREGVHGPPPQLCSLNEPTARGLHESASETKVSKKALDGWR